MPKTLRGFLVRKHDSVVFKCLCTSSIHLNSQIMSKEKIWKKSKIRPQLERSKKYQNIERRSKDRIKIEVQIEKGNKSPNRKGK